MTFEITLDDNEIRRLIADYVVEEHGMPCEPGDIDMEVIAVTGAGHRFPRMSTVSHGLRTSEEIRLVFQQFGVC